MIRRIFKLHNETKKVLTLNSKIHIAASIIGIIFLIWFFINNYNSIVPEVIDYPKIDNSNVEITSIKIDGKTYDYARTLDNSPTIGELLDASGLAGKIEENSNKTTLSKSAASGEERSEIILDSEKRLKAIELLKKYILHLRNTSVIINYTYSDGTTDTVFNNRLNEEVQENSDNESSVMNSKGTLFKIENSGVYVQNSISNVDVLLNVLKEAVENPSAVEFKAVDAGGGYVSYQVTFDTVEDFVEIYTNLTPEDKTMMITSIKDEIAKKSDSDANNGRVCFEFIAGNEWSLNVYNTIIIDNEHILNWYFQGFYETFDWKLDTQIYSKRLKDDDKVLLANKALRDVRNLMDDYSKVEIDYKTGDIKITSDEVSETNNVTEETQK